MPCIAHTVSDAARLKYSQNTAVTHTLKGMAEIG